MININQIKVEINNCGIYHKINYNDDFNLNKKLKTPKNNIKKSENLINVNAHYKTKPLNLTSHNSINQINNRNKINSKKDFKESISKIMNKEINIVVHMDKSIKKDNNKTTNNIALNKLKNKFFLMRIKLIKNALKMIKDAL